MREVLFKLYADLKVNGSNTICFFRNNTRQEKTFAEFVADVDLALLKLNYLAHTNGAKNIAILGPASYDWIVFDMACIKGGFLSIAIPETFSSNEVEKIIKDTKADVVLMDFSLLRKKYLLSSQVFYIECPNSLIDSNNIWNVQEYDIPISENLILEVYGIIFSAGTSEKVKYIKGTFHKLEKNKTTILSEIKKIGQYIAYKRSFWSKRDNKIIIFMPFSHPQQREFFRQALLRKFDIVLSSPQNCVKHVITEKPNIMISVPVIYEAISKRIVSKIEGFNTYKKGLYNIFKLLKVNTFSNGNPIKQLFSLLLFKEIKKVYGGRADFFISGSAPIAREVIEIFYSVGVKIFQAYGQTETGNIAMNTHKHFKIGSVGKPLMPIKISDESEILIKYSKILHSVNKNILKVDANGYIHSGDLGYIDEEGYLFINGRKDEVIVLDNGEKIYPHKIESLIKTFPNVKEACVLVKDGYKLQVVLDCTGNPSTLEIKRLLQTFNNTLAPHERIKSFYLAETGFCEESGLLTTTLKKKRESIKIYYNGKNFILV